MVRAPFFFCSRRGAEHAEVIPEIYKEARKLGNQEKIFASEFFPGYLASL